MVNSCGALQEEGYGSVELVGVRRRTSASARRRRIGVAIVSLSVLMFVGVGLVAAVTLVSGKGSVVSSLLSDDMQGALPNTDKHVQLLAQSSSASSSASSSSAESSDSSASSSDSSSASSSSSDSSSASSSSSDGSSSGSASSDGSSSGSASSDGSSSGSASSGVNTEMTVEAALKNQLELRFANKEKHLFKHELQQQGSQVLAGIKKTGSLGQRAGNTKLAAAAKPKVQAHTQSKSGLEQQEEKALAKQLKLRLREKQKHLYELSLQRQEKVATAEHSKPWSAIKLKEAKARSPQVAKLGSSGQHPSAIVNALRNKLNQRAKAQGKALYQKQLRAFLGQQAGVHTSPKDSALAQKGNKLLEKTLIKSRHDDKLNSAGHVEHDTRLVKAPGKPSYHKWLAGFEAKLRQHAAKRRVALQEQAGALKQSAAERKQEQRVAVNSAINMAKAKALSSS